jgi:hypothetical protein
MKNKGQQNKEGSSRVKVHPVSVPGFTGTNEELGAAIAKMRYDQVIEVLDGFRAETLRQSEADIKLKRFQLHGHLLLSLGEIDKVVMRFKKIFSFCQPYLLQEMKQEQKAQK